MNLETVQESGITDSRDLAKKEFVMQSNLFSPLLIRSIIGGIFNYKEVFATFLQDTTQKKDTAMLLGIFADKMQKNQVILCDEKVVNVADIGCADGTSCLQYLEKLNYPIGFNYVGIDVLEELVLEARKHLPNHSMIKQATVIKGDAFSGTLRQRHEFSSKSFDLLFVSHSAYFVKKENRLSFIKDIANILAKNGVAILLHESSFNDLRSKYGGGIVGDTPQLLEEATKTVGLADFQSIGFTSKLHFKPLESYLWEALKYPDKYPSLQQKADFVNTL